MCDKDAFGDAMNVEKNVVVTTSIYEGIKVIKDCKIIFDNAKDIVIGDMYNNTTPGIEIVPGVTLTMELRGRGNVNVYGGSLHNWGNRYSYAGIYVPEGSTLIINGNDVCVLNVVGYLGAAGIGGCGVAMYSRDDDYSVINAGSICIKKGNVVASSSCINDELYGGVGAGIGGGGLFNAIDRDNLVGGSVDSIEICNGNVTAIGGGCNDCAGVGAGIGGGGVCNVANDIDCIKGGNLKKIRIQKGNITARGGSNNNVKGLGAGIGGGGIFSKGLCDKFQEGRLVEFLDEQGAQLNISGGYKKSVSIGSGVIQHNDTCIKGAAPVVSFRTKPMGIIEVMKQSNKKIFSSVVMVAVGFLIMLGK